MTPTLYSKGLALYRRHRSIVDYLFWGVMTTLVNYVAYFACRLCFDINYLISNIAAWTIATAVAFVVNKLFVFRSLDWSAWVVFRECWQFVAARLLSGVLETAILKICVDWLGLNDAIVKIFSNVVVVIANYIFSKFIIFREKKVLLEKMEQANVPPSPLQQKGNESSVTGNDMTSAGRKRHRSEKTASPASKNTLQAKSGRRKGKLRRKKSRKQGRR